MFRSYCVYILKCADGSCYTGVTNNLEKRISQHEEGVNIGAYTYTRRPLELVFHQWFKDPDQAIAFEKQVKGWNRKKKEALIEGDWDKIVELSNAKRNVNK